MLVTALLGWLVAEPLGGLVVGLLFGGETVILAHEVRVCERSPYHMRWTTAGVMRLAFAIVSSVAT